MLGNTMQWKTILSLPINAPSGCLPASTIFPKNRGEVLWKYSLSGHQTIHIAPFLCSGIGRGTPQSRSRLTGRLKPLSSQSCIVRIHCCAILGGLPISNLRASPDICQEAIPMCGLFLTGVVPLSLETGFISSSGLRVLPQFSHWSPYAPS